MKPLLWLSLILLSSSVQSADFDFSISEQDIDVILNETEEFTISLSGNLVSSVNMTFIHQHSGMVSLSPNILNFDSSSNRNQVVVVTGLEPGFLNIKAELLPADLLDIAHIFTRITIARSDFLIYFSIVVGWLYFAAWSVSFYPQVYINWKRKSVVGLNFDFLALNLVGFSLYGIFNMGLFWIPAVENEYLNRNPMGLNPVMVNDIAFAVHAFFITAFTIGQCFFYERDDQRVSRIARIILSVYGIIIIITAILSAVDVIHWLDFLYYCSYIKLSITIIKYIPQAIMNYRRKSTVGWSIGNILLDFTGGMLSIIQMLVNAYNYDDWASIFGDLTKFGLGLFSVCFDILFMVQHYVLYRHASRKQNKSGNDSNEPPSLESTRY